MAGEHIVNYMRWVCHWRGLGNHMDPDEKLPEYYGRYILPATVKPNIDRIKSWVQQKKFLGKYEKCEKCENMKIGKIIF